VKTADVDERPALRGGAEPWQGLVKILPHMSYELAICGMIGRLDADDNWIQRGHMLLHVPQKMKLRHRGSDKQNSIGPCKFASDLMKESVVIVWVIAGSRVHILGMAMDVMVWRLNRSLVESLRVQVKDTCLIMINPHRQLTHELVLA
jgi:hypothetical protein